MIEYENLKKFKNKVLKWSYKIQRLKTFILWKTPKFRKHLAYKYWGNDDKISIPFWRALKECIELWSSESRVRYVSCDSCEAVGIDSNSEKYGWKYEGYHFWSCPKCKEKGK